MEAYGIDGDSEDLGNACPDYALGPAAGAGAYIWGGEAVGTYWEERYFLDRVLANYNGSVYLIQGMHDWNVDPHMAVPVINQLKDAELIQKVCSDSGTTIIPTVQTTTSIGQEKAVGAKHIHR